MRAIPLIGVAAMTVLVACDAASEATITEPEPSQSRQSPADINGDLFSPSSSLSRFRARRLSLPERDLFDTLLPVGTEAIAPDGGIRDAEAATRRSRAQLRLRGTSVSDPIFYIDDERVRNPGTALGELDPERIERIEVLKGSRADQYGPGHAGGVVNIYTKRR